MSTADATEAASPTPGPGGSTTTPSALPSADSASLLTLPAHMLQHILVSAGRGAEGAVRACRQLHDAFRHALRCPPLMAAFIRGRCASDPAGALWAYRPQVRAALVGHRLPLPAHWSDPVPEPPPGPEADCAQLALMQALAAVEGASFLRSVGGVCGVCVFAMLGAQGASTEEAAGAPKQAALHAVEVHEAVEADCGDLCPHPAVP